MMLTFVLAFTVVQQAPVPCGLYKERPCYTKSVESCRCETPATMRVIDVPVESCQHKHGAEVAALSVVTLFIFGLFVVGLLAKTDQIASAWRRAEIPKRWWWAPTRWLLVTLVQCAIMLALVNAAL